MDGIVQIISSDNHFVLGLTSLLRQLNVTDIKNIVVLDLGYEFLYIFNKEKLRLARVNDAFGALVLHQHALFPRKAPVDYYKQRIKSIDYEDMNVKRKSALTQREVRVLRGLCRRTDQKELAYMLNLSEKTVSNHKINGLRKLGVKNITRLHFMLKTMEKLWPVFQR